MCGVLQGEVAKKKRFMEEFGTESDKKIPQHKPSKFYVSQYIL